MPSTNSVTAVIKAELIPLDASGGCDAIVTYNKRHFGNVEKFGLIVLSPKEFLAEIGVLK
jgi:hypothetical protein